VENRVGDLKDQKQIKGIFDGLDAVIHLAAIPSPTAEWEKIHENNIATDHNVYMECLNAGVKRVVYASSNHTQHGRSKGEKGVESILCDKFGAHLNPPNVIHLEDPVDPDGYYGISKVHGEAQGRFFARQHGLEVVSLRIGWLVPSKNPFDDERVDSEHKREFMRAIYLGHRDCQEFIVRAIEPLPESARLGKGAYVLAYAVSNNPRSLFDLETTIKALGYRPQESVEPYYEEYLKRSGRQEDKSEEKEEASGKKDKIEDEGLGKTHKSAQETPGQITHHKVEGDSLGQKTQEAAAAGGGTPASTITFP